MKHSFQGLGVALITPFRADLSIDYTALETLIEEQIRQKIDYLCILGTTAETPTLTEEEKQSIKTFVVEHVRGRLPILMGCGGNNTAKVVAQLREGDFAGIDGILSVCPYYNKPAQEGLYQHFAAIAAATALPVVLYNIPGRSATNIEPATLLRLAADCANIVAVKEASGNLEQIQTLLRNKPAGFDVISGDDALTYDIITSGGTGVISVIGNALAEKFGEMVHAALNGDLKKAIPVHHAYVELYRLLSVDGNPAGIKALLAAQGQIENVLRLPLVPARAETQQKIRAFA